MAKTKWQRAKVLKEKKAEEAVVLQAEMKQEIIAKMVMNDEEKTDTNTAVKDTISIDSPGVETRQETAATELASGSQMVKTSVELDSVEENVKEDNSFRLETSQEEMKEGINAKLTKIRELWLQSSCFETKKLDAWSEAGRLGLLEDIGSLETKTISLEKADALVIDAVKDYVQQFVDDTIEEELIQPEKDDDEEVESKQDFDEPEPIVKNTHAEHTVDMEIEDWTCIHQDDRSVDSDSDDESTGQAQKKNFDLALLAEIMQAADSSIEAVNNKDVVIIIGNTGSGKSLYINAVAANKQVYARSDDHNHLSYDIEGDYILGTSVGHGKNSKTKLLTHYHDHRSGLTFIDTAGFLDTDAYEYETATAMQIKRIAQNCTSIRFVVMINAMSLMNDRAGSFRDLTVLIKKFIGDNYNDFKDSFQFVFTHIDEVTHFNQSEDKYAAILKELREIKNTISSYQDHRPVIKSMIKKLENKERHHVDIFRPLDSDIQELHAGLSRLQPLQNTQQHIRCALPPTSLRGIQEAISTLFDQTKMLFETKNNDDLALLARDFKHIQYIIFFIEHYRTKDQAQALIDLVCKEAKQMQSEAQSLIQSHMNGSSPLEEVVRCLKRCALLERITDSNTNIYQIMAERLKNSREALSMSLEDEQSLQDEKAASFETIAFKLNTLSMWLEVSDLPFEMSEIYGNIGSAVSSAAKKAFDGAQSADTSEWRTLIKALLQMIDLQKSALLKESDMSPAIESKIENLVYCVTNSMNSALEAAHTAVVDNIFVKTTEKLSDLVDLDASISAIENETLTTAVHRCLEDLKQLIKNGSEFRLKMLKSFLELDTVGSAIVGSLLRSLQAFLDCTGSIHNGLSYSILRSASALIDNAAQDARRHLAILCKQLATTRLAIPQEHQKQLQALEAYASIEIIFPQAEVNYSEEVKFYKNRYADYFEVLVRDLVESLSAILKGDLDKFERLKADFDQLLMAREIWPMYENEFLSSARDLLRNWCHESRPLLRTKFIECCEDQSWHLEISKVLRMCEEFIDMKSFEDARSPCITPFREDILNFLKDVLESVRAAMNRKGEFETKGKLLAAAEACDVDAPSLMTLIYPKKEMHAVVVQQIKRRSDLIQEEIEESIPNYECIEDKIRKLDEAGQYVDTFIGYRASENANRLRGMLNSKVATANERLQELIADRDYEHIGQYLEPLEKAKDRFKQEEYNKLCTRCTEMVLEDIRSLGAILHVPGSATEKIGRLRALKAVNPAFRRALQSKSCDLQKKINDLDRTLCTNAGQKIKLLENALDKYLYNKVIELEKSLDDIKMLCPHINLYQATSRKIDPLRARINSQFDEIKSTAEAFIDSLQSEEQSLALKLSRQLNGLKQSIDQDGDDCDTRIKKCYQAVTTMLSQRIKNFRDETFAFLVENDYFLEGKTHLIQLKKKVSGMVHHLNIFDISAEIKIIEDMRCHHNLQYSNFSEVSICKCKSTLDNLKSRKGVKASVAALLFGAPRNPDYEATKKNFLTTIHACRSEIEREVQCGDFRSYSLTSKMDLLKICEIKLSSHIPQVSAIVQDAENFLESRFAESVTVLKQLLDDGKVSALREAFDSYYELSSLQMDDEASRIVVHTSLLSFVKKSIQILETLLSHFNFKDVPALVAKLSETGFVMVSNFALYNQDLKLKEMDKTTEFKQLKQLSHETFQDATYTEIGVHYARLGLLPGASANDVTRAYKLRIRTTHPDKCPNPKKKQLMTQLAQRLNESKDVLNIAQKRTKFQNLQYQFKFLNHIQSLPENLKKNVRGLLEGRAYEQVKLIYSRCLSDLHHVSSLVKPQFNAKQVANRLGQIIKSHIKALRTSVQTHWNDRQYIKLQTDFYALRQLETLFSSESTIIDTSWIGVRAEIEDEIEKLAQELSDSLSSCTSENMAFAKLPEFAIKLIRIGRILDGLPDFKGMVRLKMTQTLDTCRDKSWGFPFLFKLGQVLEEGEQIEKDGDDDVGRAIVAEFSHFNEVRTWCWNDETVKKPAEASIKEITTEVFISPTLPATACSLESGLLLQQYESYEHDYNRLFDKYILADDPDRTNLIKEVKERARLLPRSSIESWDTSVIDALPFLLAGICALFTIQKSGDSFNRLTDSDSNKDNSNVLMKPHPVQVLTILNVLTKPRLPNHFMEVKTGEGKSMILGATSAVLAVLGFDVRVTCYSEYLSDRDNALFHDCFVALGVRNFIQYSKITKLREFQIAKRVDIRQRTLDLFRGCSESSNCVQSESAVALATEKSFTASSAVRTLGHRPAIPATRTSAPAALPRKTILLVDEVDVLFGSSYYGQTYNQVALLEDDRASALLCRIWIERNSHVGFGCIRQWPEYVALISKYSEWRFIIDTEVRSMCSDVLKYNEPPYVFNEKTSRIGYASHDSIDYELVYGYRTTFAYLAESEARGIAVSNSVLCLRLLTSQFSYANIMPFRILGVSGTLSALTSREKDVILKMGVSNYSFIPSVYGSSKFSFDRSGRGIIFQETLEGYLLTISQEIERRVREGRAVVVFFETYERLKNFQSSKYGQQIKYKNILCSSMSADEKDFVIKRSMHVGQVTLATSIFGRGTDFFCKDKKLEKNGGSFIIQTFLSLEKSEEVQIQGRTARQGKLGGYGMILLIPDLVNSYDIDPNSLTNIAHADVYNHLDALRRKKHEFHLDTLEENLIVANQRDTVSEKYLDALAQDKVSEAIQCLHDVYAQVASHAVDAAVDCHFLIDVSGSMRWKVSDGRTQLCVAKEGVKHIITNLLDANRGDTFSLTTFSARYSNFYHMRPVDDKLLLLNAVDALSTAGGTMLFTAFIQKLKQVLSTRTNGSQQFLFCFTDGVTSDCQLFGELKALVEQIPEVGFKCILAAVGLHRGQFRNQLEALAQSGKVELILFESTDQISDAFDVAAEAIVELTGGYTS